MTRSSVSRHPRSDSPFTSLAVGVAAVLLASCAVGPRFRAPDAPAVADTNHPYTPGPLPTSTDSAPGAGGGAAQRFVSGQSVPAEWWTLFHSEPLDRLIRAGLAQSPTVASAQAALREAREAYAAGFGNSFLPSVSAQVGGAREQVSGAAFGLGGLSPFTLYNASVGVSYAPDVFGGARRGQEGLAATRDFQRFEVEAAYLSLSANLVTTAIEEASLRAQVQVTRELVRADSQGLAIARKQGALGAVALSTVLAQETALAQTEATLPVLENALAQTRHLLAVYAGRLPSDAGLPEFDLDSLQLPGRVAREPAVLPRTATARRLRERGDSASGERTDRGRDGEPPSTVQPERQRWVGGRRPEHPGLRSQ